jgi:hypothetical protein
MKGNKKSQMADSALAEVDDFAAKFENEFSLLACLSSSASVGVWYIDNGASSHMTGVHDYFSRLKEELDLYIEMGNNLKCRATSHGIVPFQRESKKQLMVKDVSYVLWLTKKYDFNFGLRGQGLRDHIPSSESVHSAQGLLDSQSNWSQER